MVTTLAQKEGVQRVFRLSGPMAIAKLREAFAELGDAPSEKEVFLRLRELRNSW